MEIIVYREGEQKVESGYTVEHLPELLSDETLVVWVDMEKPSEEDDRILLDVFHFHPLTVEDCRENRHYPKIEEFPNYLYFIVHGVTADTSPDRFNTIELDGFLGPNYVITYHHDMFRSINNVKKQLTTSPVTCQRGPAFLLHQILDQIVDYYSPVLDDFDERIDQLEDNIFSLKRPNDAILEQIMELKRSVLRLRRISAKQMDIFYRLSRGEVHLIPQPMLPFYRDIYDHLIRVTDLAESYRDLIGGALEAYLSVVSNRMNEIMKVLTIFSAVMLPLTFLAGVYGMNFDNIPELHTRYGYFGIWIVMILVAVIMLSLFWRAGWIGSPQKKTAREEGKS
ncbi:MAG TPA: magnesium/cobalt transporter CorA [Pyrinomonadaceae bacterium]|nr:magnesium/cobalt transporter CorA [Pyrinomonadaceae bacterium]